MFHYDFGSSTAARTDACQQWKSQSEGVPKKDSVFAQDGTAVHDMLERRALDDDYDFEHERKDLSDLAREMWTITATILDLHKAQEWEPEVTATTAEDVGGTLDLVVRCPDRSLLIDYKAGMGVQVAVENNKQILFAAANMLFGESSAADLVEGMEEFTGIIVQPDRSGEVTARSWAFNLAEVEAFWKSHQDNIRLARNGEGELSAGDHCKFCPANGLCDATTGNLLRMAQLDPDDLDQVAWGLDHIEQVKKTIAKIEAMAFDALESGQKIPGWKLVMGKPGNTAWTDIEVAMRKLKRMCRGLKLDDVRVPTLFESKKFASPTQAKKILKQAGVDTSFVDELTYRPPAKSQTLAKESDPRPEVLSTAAFKAAMDSIK